MAVLTDQPDCNLARRANWRSLGHTQASLEIFLCRGLPEVEDSLEVPGLAGTPILLEVEIPPTGLVAALREPLILP